MEKEELVQLNNLRKYYNIDVITFYNVLRYVYLIPQVLNISLSSEEIVMLTEEVLVHLDNNISNEDFIVPKRKTIIDAFKIALDNCNFIFDNKINKKTY